MYQDLKVVLNIGKTKETMSQNVGVRQGDCMAPVLFLFMVMDFSETLEKEWTKAGLSMIKLQQRSHSPQDTGKLIGHKVKTFSQGNLLTLFCVLYVDDGAFPFENRLQIELGLSLIHNHFIKFGIEMHIGRGKKASKTVCIFFPPPGLFHQKEIVSHEINVENMVSIRISKQIRGESNENKCKREESLYIVITEKNRNLWQMAMSHFGHTSSTWAPGFPSHYRTIMVCPIELPL